MRNEVPSRTREPTIVIAGLLVRYLRAQVKNELSNTLEILLSQIDNGLTPQRWHNALKRFNEGYTLLEELGLTDDPIQDDIELNLQRSPRAILRSLETQYEDDLQRMRDAKADGFDPADIGKDVPALAKLVREVQKQTGLNPRRKRQQSYLQAQLDTRRKGRRRGDAK